MKTIVLENPGHFALTDTTAPPDPGPGEAAVRVHRVGICGTDLHAYRGRQPFFSYPRILGHELGIEVVAVGEGVDRVKVGDRCAVEPYLNCGHCIACRRSKPNCCEHLRVLGVHTDGGMRTRINVPASKLHPSQKLSLEQLALVETLGIGAHGVARTAIESGEGVLVIGAGPIGLGVMQFALAAGGNVVTMDINEDRLRFCRDVIGVKHTVVASPDAAKALRDALGGDLPTAVLDATGNAKSMAGTFNLVAPGGRITFVGLFAGDVTFHDPDFHRLELTLRASRNSAPEDFTRIIAMIEDGRIDVTPWITHRAAADEMIAQFDHWLDPASGVIKAMVDFGTADCAEE